MDLNLLQIISGLVVGLSLGLTGGGGSILAIPLLVYVLKVPVTEAIYISLLMVALIAFFGAVKQHFGKNVDWKSAILFSLMGIVVAPIVVYFSKSVDDNFRLIMFASLMLFVSYRMISSRHQLPQTTQGTNSTLLLRSTKIATGGGVAGALSGFFGVGGGFIIVPLLTLIFKMPYRVAVGTSLACIFMISISAVSSAILSDANINIPLFINFLIGGIVGILGGSWLINRLHNNHCKTIFAVLTALMAVFMLIDKILIY
ncbi:MAG: sulfite exporter TauE/SafE family protein [Alphaproteobacteria bacterium]